MKKRAALVLAGGAVTGLAYMAGACQAFDEIMYHRGINELDFYSGISAGSVLASCLANNISPISVSEAVKLKPKNLNLKEKIKERLDRYGELTGVPSKDVDQFLPYLLYTQNFGEFAIKTMKAPWEINKAFLKYAVGHVRRGRANSYIDLMRDLLNTLPLGAFSTKGIEKYLNYEFRKEGRTTDFNKLETELMVSSTNLRTGDRAMFGSTRLKDKAYAREFHDDISIPKAVAASCALPVFFSPVEIKGEQYIDGAISRTANCRAAAKLGEADLVIIMNPLVPYKGPKVKGLITLLEQTYRSVAKTRIDMFLKTAKRDCPNTTFIRIEPHQENPTMFANPFQFEKMDSCIKEGKEKVKRIFREYQDDLEKVFDETGIGINKEKLKSENGNTLCKGLNIEPLEEILFNKAT